MNIKKKSFFAGKAFAVLLLMSFASFSYSQDVHFSQSLASPVQNNPSFNNEADIRFSLMSVFRRQWAAIGVPFETNALYFNAPVYTHEENLVFYAGLNYTNDKSGDSKLTMNQMVLNTGATYQMDLNTFGFAVSNGFISKSSNSAGLTFPSQYDRQTGGFNEALDNGEIELSETLNYYDLGIGFSWQRILSDKVNFKAGFSSLHINEGQETFLNSNNRKKAGYGFQYKLNYKFHHSYNLEPYFSYYQTVAASELVWGSAIELRIFESEKVKYIKPFLYLRNGFDRNADAIVIGSEIGVGVIDIGLSYDINVSDLEIASNYKGGFELVLVYKARYPKYERKNKACERY